MPEQFMTYGLMPRTKYPEAIDLLSVTVQSPQCQMTTLNIT
jgi:hypothetical protein